MGSAYFLSCFFIQTIIFLTIFSSPTYAIGENQTDQLSLLEFKAKMTDDHFDVMSSWNDTIHFCKWYGVTCNSRHQRVATLDLSSLKLSGSISPHIGNLSFLRELLLQNNSLSDEIPPEIGSLRRLRIIRLDSNSFNGEIPANMSSCSKLNVINLGFNKLVGKVPSEFGSFSLLQELNIRANNLTGGIPSFFGNFSSLLALVARDNTFGGSIPESLGKLKNLEYINIGNTTLSGTIPPSLYNISSMNSFFIGENQIQGTLPTDLGITLPNLEEISIGTNQFTGVIPVSISNATNLVRFMALENKLTGKIPNLEKLHKLQWLSVSMNNLGTGYDDLSFFSSLTNATSLQLVALHHNNLRGSLPESIGNLSTTFEVLSLSSNQIFGTIPTGIQNLINLQVLYLDNNQFTGSIPTRIGMLKKLNWLYLNANKLSGNIPSSLGNLSLVSVLSLELNNLHGQIPSSIGKCQNLLLLDLSDNNLTGPIPKEVIGLSSLSRYLDLSKNRLTGSLPNEVGNLKNLGALYVAGNMLSGIIPSSFGSCVRLEILRMQQNFFQGAIPSTLSSLRGLEVLDLSRNNLTGQIPVFLEDFSLLTDLDLSFNDFEGMVPVEGVFKNASAALVMGNNKLCGGIPEFHLPICTIKESNKRRLTLTMKLIIIISGSFGVISVLSCLCLWLVRKKRDTHAPASSLLGRPQMSYQSLLKATGGFSSNNLIGIGGFGSVYKGIFDEDGTVVAVKVLNLPHHGASKSFMAECEALRNIKHRNLVKIVTVCSGVDYHGNDFKALVYEFMANGSLEEWLHPSPTVEESHEGPRVLNFLQRLNVAIDVSCALDYLHHQCQIPIVHCDLKPSNVLLDHDMTGHVGDFGQAKLLSEPKTNHTSQTSSFGVRGTVGYAAPEYGMGSEVSTRGDLYSYGILLLELFTGKRPIGDMFKEGLSLNKYARDALPQRVTEIVDPILLQEIVNVEMSGVQDFQECLNSIFEVGVTCSSEFPQERMNMSDVTAKLQSVRCKVEKLFKFLSCEAR